MIVIRTVLQGHFGKGGELAAHIATTNRQIADAMAQHFGRERHWRVLSDLGGAFDRVAFEVELESLTEWDQARAVLFGLPAFREAMAQSQALVVSGHNEYWTVEADG